MRVSCRSGVGQRRDTVGRGWLWSLGHWVRYGNESMFNMLTLTTLTRPALDIARASPQLRGGRKLPEPEIERLAVHIFSN